MTMNIKQVYNLKNKTTIKIQDIFQLKYLGQFLFSLPAIMDINWNKVEELNYDAYRYKKDLNVIYTLEYEKEPFIVVVHNLTTTQLIPYCTNQHLYEQMMKHFLIYSEFQNCKCLVDDSKEIIFDNTVKDNYDLGRYQKS